MSIFAADQKMSPLTAPMPISDYCCGAALILKAQNRLEYGVSDIFLYPVQRCPLQYASTGEIPCVKSGYLCTIMPQAWPQGWSTSQVTRERKSVWSKPCFSRLSSQSRDPLLVA